MNDPITFRRSLEMFGRDYTVVAEAAVEMTSHSRTWKVVRPATNVIYGWEFTYLAQAVAVQSNLDEDGFWRVRVWHGHDADTSVVAAFDLRSCGCEYWDFNAAEEATNGYVHR